MHCMYIKTDCTLYCVCTVHSMIFGAHIISVAAVIGLAFGVLENVKGTLGKVFGAGDTFPNVPNTLNVLNVPMLGAILFTLLGVAVAIETATLRFDFSEDSFSLVSAKGEDVGENMYVGGANTWKYKSFVNYAFVPSESFPILVYFKETQTPIEQQREVSIAPDKLPGQGHFFTAICKTSTLRSNDLIDFVS